MKRLGLGDYFVCLFVLFLELELQGNNPELHYFSPVPKRFTLAVALNFAENRLQGAWRRLTPCNVLFLRNILT